MSLQDTHTNDEILLGGPAELIHHAAETRKSFPPSEETSI